MASLQQVPSGPTYTFPCGVLNYDPYVPAKRSITKQTSKGSFTQVSTPLFLHGMQEIDWSIPMTTQQVAFSIRDLYNLNTNFVFKGEYGEEYLVEFKELKLTAKSGYFELTGKFRVICEEDQAEPICG